MADEDGNTDCAMVLIQFMNNFKQVTTCLMVMGQEALKSARRARLFTSCLDLMGKETEHHLSIASYFD